MNSDAPNDTRNLIDRYKGMAVDSIKQDMQQQSHKFHVAIENFQHDINIGSIVRSANAFNTRAIHIIGKKHWNKRGAMSTEKYLNVFYYPDSESFFEWVKASNMPLIGIDNIEGSVNLSTVTLPDECVLVFGQEGPGFV
jgi:tRNA G18 (ribose-2'-O)-methylase SpoU